MSYKKYACNAAEMATLIKGVGSELRCLVIAKAAGSTVLASMRETIDKLKADPAKSKELIAFVDQVYRPKTLAHEALVAKWEECNAKYEAMEAAMFSLEYIADLNTQTNAPQIAWAESVAKLLFEEKEKTDLSFIQSKIAPGLEFEPTECTETPVSLEPGAVAALHFNPLIRGWAVLWRTPALVLRRVTRPDTGSTAYVVCYFHPHEDQALTYEVVEETRLLGGPKDARFMEKLAK
jgi:hypothetical protein